MHSKIFFLIINYLIDNLKVFKNYSPCKAKIYATLALQIAGILAANQMGFSFHLLLLMPIK